MAPKSRKRRAKANPRLQKRTKTIRVQLQTGHDCLFTKEPPEHLQIECSICLCVLCDPVLIDCSCGACFCGRCIEPTLEAKKPCPLCNSPFKTSLPDRRLQRTLNNLEVYCPLKEAGCTWKGEMGAVAEHLNLSPSSDNRESGCHFVELACLHCEEEFQRKLLHNHEVNECLQRPFKCSCCDDYESTFEDVTTKHVSVCPSRLMPCANECGETLQRKDLAGHLKTTCPLHVIECSFHYAGCEEKLPRKDMPAHIKDNLAEHMSLQAISTERQLKEQAISTEQQLKQQAITHQQQVDELKYKVQSLESFVRAHLQIMPFTLIVNNFSKMKERNVRWNSEPFYTHSCGYKMTSSVVPNDAEGSHVGVYAYLRHSNFDNQLTWPFRGAICIELVDQESNKEHRRHCVRFDQAPEICTYPHGGLGWECRRFISHTDLSPKYLKNDSLCFRLSYISYEHVLKYWRK